MMAGEKPYGTSDARLRLAAWLTVAALVCWAGAAAAQISAPITGTMGGADAPGIAAPAQAAPTAPSAPAARDVAQAPVTQTVTQTATAPAAHTGRVPRNVVRRDTALRVGEHAQDGMLGDETEALLALQANNLAAGPGLPMLGSTASRAYKRYLDSFTYPIPQFYPAIVQGDTGTGNNGGGGAGAAPAVSGAGASQ
ncbi:hypothetical protein PEP31012_01881 [Pandoraea eparura]|uniref:DUF3613 domain-containing protein n=1 Tax=Pandoraea eparura TaxID=2508291 RepID=A0A5E4U8W1_9BURK|nr:DUF3613 domain-containing protein [Pandoraea eparura]VVD96435.1 hypothetical protein PEP31012_01881 [Pandoraea eparura]